VSESKDIEYQHGPRADGGADGRVPDEPAECLRLREAAAALVAERGLTPPLAWGELDAAARVVVERAGCGPERHSFVMVLVHNAAWWNVLASVPFERRVLLLPPCLRDSAACPATFDALGLICARCGRCPIADLATEAERLGYAVLVAEGTSTVRTLIESGQMDGAVGVSCMTALERAFPSMARQPVPSIAIPLTRNGCSDTAMDVEWVLAAIRVRDGASRVLLTDIARLRREVETWFSESALRAVLGCGESPIERVGLEWLAKSGKRWRPFLTAGVYAALSGEAELPESVRRVAVAVECIHKASLVYDDIQDRDTVRYGEPTLHASYGVPLALNVGLDLLGQGYRLLAESGAPAEIVARMMALATRGHCRLCVGQGAELWWKRAPEPLSAAQVLEMFRLKTAPSFVVVFGLGAILGGADAATLAALDGFSEALGVAYQIRDDLDDLSGAGDVDDVLAGRLSVVVAVAYERAAEGDRRLIEAAWRGGDAEAARRVRDAVLRTNAEQLTLGLLEDYRQRALEALASLRNVALKILLHRVAWRVLDRAPDEARGDGKREDSTWRTE
jgi:geranylgeranyl diphosphate synthase type II